MVREVLRLRKEVVEEEEVVEEDLRKEEIDIEDGTERDRKENDLRKSAEKLRRVPQRTPIKTGPEERPKKHGETYRQKEGSREGKRQGANKVKAAKENRGGLLLEGYDDLTVEEAKKKIGGLSEEELKTIRYYEKRHKNRKTLVEQINRKIKEAS